MLCIIGGLVGGALVLLAQTDRGRPRGWQSGVVPLLCPRRFRRRGWPERDYGPSR